MNTFRKIFSPKEAPESFETTDTSYYYSYVVFLQNEVLKFANFSNLCW